MPKKISSPPACLAIDFDNTIAYFQDTYEGLFDIFIRRGVLKDKAAKAYEIAKEGGFSFGKMIKSVEKETDANPPAGGWKQEKEKMTAEFGVWLKNSLILFPESASFLAQISKKIPVVIVTFGNRSYQRDKISRLKISAREIMSTADKNGKPDLIKKCLEKYGQPVLFADDKGEELDRARDNFSEKKVTTVRVRRASWRYKREKTRHRHITVSNLQELKKFFKN